MNERFGRDARLTQASEFNRVFQCNRRSSDRCWTVLYARNQLSDARLGMAISKKCAKRAVDRNRLKRLCRDSFRQHKQSIAGFDIVLLAKPTSVSASNEELCKSLLMHWSKIAQNT